MVTLYATPLAMRTCVDIRKLLDQHNLSAGEGLSSGNILMDRTKRLRRQAKPGPKFGSRALHGSQRGLHLARRGTNDGVSVFDGKGGQGVDPAPQGLQ